MDGVICALKASQTRKRRFWLFKPQILFNQKLMLSSFAQDFFPAGHEKERLTVTLAVYADGTKLPPLVHLPGVRPLPKNEVPNGVVVFMCGSGKKSWANEESINFWLKRIWGLNNQKRRFLVWDAFRALNGLFHETSASCNFDVHPPGITHRSELYFIWTDSLMDGVICALKASQTRKRRFWLYSWLMFHGINRLSRTYQKFMMNGYFLDLWRKPKVATDVLLLNL
jgi:hypothetical protein